MAYKFINMIILFLISMIIATVISSPVDFPMKSSENSLLKAALEFINSNSRNTHGYNSGKLIDAESVVTETDLRIPEISSKNLDTNFNHVNGRFKRGIYTNEIAHEYIDKVYEQEVEKGYTGTFHTNMVIHTRSEYGSQFIIMYSKKSEVNCSSNKHKCKPKYINDSNCIMIVDHPDDSEVSLKNIIYSHCHDTKKNSEVRIQLGK